MLFTNYLQYKKNINNNTQKTNLNNNNIISNNFINNNDNTQKMKIFNQNFDKNDEIMNLFFKLYNKGLVSDIIEIKDKKEIVAKKVIISEKYLKKGYNLITKKWIPAWHGTKVEYLESIIKYGLHKPGTKLSNTEMTPQNNHDLDKYKNIVDHISNWPDAIFASPRILCASDPYYSGRIRSNNKVWSCLLNIRIKPNSFTKHQSRVLVGVITAHPLCSSPIDDIIYRISSEDNVFVEAITFLLYSNTGYNTIFDNFSDENLKINYEDKLI